MFGVKDIVSFETKAHVARAFEPAGSRDVHVPCSSITINGNHGPTRSFDQSDQVGPNPTKSNLRNKKNMPINSLTSANAHLYQSSRKPPESTPLKPNQA
jgi:hypothetical protein